VRTNVAHSGIAEVVDEAVLGYEGLEIDEVIEKLSQILLR
jgi:hypothetical protein